jgi:hypothetical protein
MNSEDEIKWNNLTDRLLASLESSRKMERQMQVDLNADAAKRQRNLSLPKEPKVAKSIPKKLSKTNNKFQTRRSIGS